MLLLSGVTLPEGEEWMYEIKLDGYRAIAFKRASTLQLRSRNDNDFSTRYPLIARALTSLPDETVIDGEIVALDEPGRPSFQRLQNYGASGIPLIFYVFDIMMLSGRDVMGKPLSKRRELLETKVLPKMEEPIRYSPALHAPLPDLIESVSTQGFEGLIAKDLTSVYEPGQRSGAWKKMRVQLGQEFVIGGYTIGGNGFDALIFGYYDNEHLLYASRTRNGFTPALRVALATLFRKLITRRCPFSNLPEEKSGRWGVGLTEAKMKECVWLQPTLVGQFEFVEWTSDHHLRHSRFVALREDRDPKSVRREG